MSCLRQYLAVATYLLPLLLCGCVLPGEGNHRVHLEPEKRFVAFSQEFEVAAAAPAPDCGYYLILTNSKLPQYAQEQTGTSRVYPLFTPEMTQVVFIHVAWRPQRSSKSDFPAATNSTFRWMIFSQDKKDYLEYTGIGFVRIDFGKTKSVFHFQDIALKAKESRGQLTDTLGRTRFSGTVRATNDASLVRELTRHIDEEPNGQAVPSATTRPQKPLENANMPPARGPRP